MDNDERPSIHVRTTDAVDLWLFRVGKECARQGVRFNGRKVGKEQILNAILSVASTNEPSEFVQQISSGLEAFRRHLDEMGIDQSDDDEQIVVKVPSPQEAQQCHSSRSSSSR